MGYDPLDMELVNTEIRLQISYIEDNIHKIHDEDNIHF
jgi:hypothetical protein